MVSIIFTWAGPRLILPLRNSNNLEVLNTVMLHTIYTNGCPYAAVYQTKLACDSGTFPLLYSKSYIQEFGNCNQLKLQLRKLMLLPENSCVVPNKWLYISRNNTTLSQLSSIDTVSTEVFAFAIISFIQTDVYHNMSIQSIFFF